MMLLNRSLNKVTPASIPFLILGLFIYLAPLEAKASTETDTLKTEILIAGGSTSGFAAAIQAARAGKEVIIVETSPWLGGMLTSAGVSATDGNHKLAGGLWKEFRDQLEMYYGGPDSVSTGWVSNTLFEPKVGKSIIHSMVASYTNIRVIHGYHIIDALVNRKKMKLMGAVFESNNYSHKFYVRADISIDATEYGDLMAQAGVPYRVGMDPRAITGEEISPEEGNDFIQDLTYVAILKDYGKGTDRTVPKPPNYDPSKFECACSDDCDQPNVDALGCERMLDYGKLPNGKYMINWPNFGNDYYLNPLEMTYRERQRAYLRAKNHTLNFVFYIQNDLGYKHIGLAEDEYPTPDHLPFKPYMRSTRRMEGQVTFKVKDIEDRYHAESRPPLYRTAIAVGDYPLDHHRKKNPVPRDLTFPKIPSFSIPLGSLVPQDMKGLIVAEKSISVTSLANGTTRLQPVVIGIGQAAGALAAHVLEKNTTPQQADIRAIQADLLADKCFLMPFLDVPPEHWAFEYAQRVGVTGIMRGEGLSVNWANETRFYPDSTLSIYDFKEIMARAGYGDNDFISNMDELYLANAIEALWTINGSPKPLDEVANYYDDLDKSDSYNQAVRYAYSKGWTQTLDNGSKLGTERKITRADLAYLIDMFLNPFEKPVNFKGEVID